MGPEREVTRVARNEGFFLRRSTTKMQRDALSRKDLHPVNILHTFRGTFSAPSGQLYEGGPLRSLRIHNSCKEYELNLGGNSVCTVAMYGH